VVAAPPTPERISGRSQDRHGSPADIEGRVMVGDIGDRTAQAETATIKFFVGKGDNMSNMNRRDAVKACLVTGAFFGSPVLAQKRYDKGASDTEIKIGQTWALSGPLSSESYQTKIHAAYFRSINDRGGINGRKIKLITLDDGYSPPRTLEQTRKLVEQEEVLFIAMPFGSPTNAATQRYLGSAGVPQVLVMSGASRFFDHKAWPWSTGTMPPLETEGAIYARHVLKATADPAWTSGPAKIGILYQNDDFGRDIVKGVKEGLGGKAASTIVHEATYEPTDPTLDSQLIALKSSGANVFMNFTAGRLAPLSIRRARELGWRPLQIITSAWASIENLLKPVGVENSTGITSLRYLKEPSDKGWAEDAALRPYLEFMQKYVPDVDPKGRNAELAYLTVSLTARIIEQAGDDLTRANIIKQATSLANVTNPVLLSGVSLTVTDQKRDAFNQFEMVRFDGEKWVSLGMIQNR
jgi:ABC-type branched-subunit amino acid transport system substrate-binding protein